MLNLIRQSVNNCYGETRQHMKVFNYSSIEAETVDCCPSNVQVRWLITKDMGANNFAMRLFEIGPDGNTPLHTHHWEHEIFILGGKGAVFDGTKTTSFKKDDVVFIPSDERHQLRNTGKKLLKLLCLIPNNKE